MGMIEAIETIEKAKIHFRCQIATITGVDRAKTPNVKYACEGIDITVEGRRNGKWFVAGACHRADGKNNVTYFMYDRDDETAEAQYTPNDTFEELEQMIIRFTDTDAKQDGGEVAAMK